MSEATQRQALRMKRAAKARVCMARLRAERAGKDTSQFPPRERGPKSNSFHGGTLDRLRKLYPDLKWEGSWKPVEGGGRTWHYAASNGWVARWASCSAMREDGGDEPCTSRCFIYKDSTKEPVEEVTHIMQDKFLSLNQPK